MNIKKVLELKPSIYQMRVDEYAEMNFIGGMHIGFIAQEIQEVFPVLVSKNVYHNPNNRFKFSEYLSVNYIGLIPILTHGIQEQQVMIEEQQRKIEEQETRIAKLENAVEILMKK